MPMFSLGSLSSMTSNKILKTPVIRNSKQVWYPLVLDIDYYLLNDKNWWLSK